jgi:hypothetical protein
VEILIGGFEVKHLTLEYVTIVTYF